MNLKVGINTIQMLVLKLLKPSELYRNYGFPSDIRFLIRRMPIRLEEMVRRMHQHLPPLLDWGSHWYRRHLQCCPHSYHLWGYFASCKYEHDQEEVRSSSAVVQEEPQ